MKVHYTEKVKAYANFRALLKAPANRNTLRRFNVFLGVGEDVMLSPFWNDNVEMSDEAAEKIKWLNGPHAYTFYQAWKARHGG